MPTKVKAKRVPKRVVASFPLSFYRDGKHIYDDKDAFPVKTDGDSIVLLTGGEVGLGGLYRGGRFLIDRLVQMKIPLGTEIRVTMEPIRRRGRNATWHKIKNPDAAPSIRLE